MNNNDYLSRKKSDASSYKSIQTFNTNSSDGCYFQGSHRDSGIIVDCETLKNKFIDQQKTVLPFNSKETNNYKRDYNDDDDDSMQVSQSLINEEFYGKVDNTECRLRCFEDHENKSGERLCTPFTISNFLEENYFADFNNEGCEISESNREGSPQNNLSNESTNNDRQTSLTTERWNHFLSRTTLHGIKYAFEDGPVSIRRIIWSLCIATCMGIFIYQAMDRLITYLQYPSNVNLKVVYSRSMEFPAVTICNYNKHRLTAVVDLNMYEFIGRLYRSGNNYFDEGNNMHELNMTNFILRTSHQQNDFIVGCTWQGLPCNDSIGFYQRMTDFGVCYTFNGDAEDRLRVLKAGSRSALGVILNVEQYEYMVGPDQETGIKILLHDPLEFPQVRDLGFAVSPGMHVLVGVKRQCLENLQPPYGTCQPGALARSQCLAICTSDEVFERCMCRDPYMKPPSKHQDHVCSFGESFFCVREGRDSTSRDLHTHCDCPNQCKMKTYDPLLSYARMSGVDFTDLNVDHDIVLQSYEKARATFERVDQESSESNRILIEKYLMNFHQLVQNVTVSQSTVKHGDSNRVVDQRVMLSYLKNYSALFDDLLLINSSFHDIVPLVTRLQPDVSFWETLVWDEHRGLDAFLDIQGTFSGLVAILELCAKAEKENRSILPEDCEDEDVISRTYLFHRKNILSKWELIANESLTTLLEMKNRYEETLHHVFHGTEFDYQSNDSYIDCLSVINNTTDIWLPHLEDLVSVQHPRYLVSNSWNEKLQVARIFESFFWLNKISDTVIVQSKFETCQFFMKPRWFNKNYNSFLNYINNANQAFLGQISLENSLLRQAEELEMFSNESFDISATALKDFFLQNSNITKIDLCELFHSEKYLTSETMRLLQMQSYLSDFQQLLIRISDVHTNMIKVYSFAFQLAVPPLSDDVIGKLQLIDVARNVSEDTEYKMVAYWLAVMTSDRRSSIIGILDVFYGKYIKIMRQVQGRLITAIQSFDSVSMELKADLRTYYEHGKLDEGFIRENFIKVEIFYKELSYEHIQQQVSFQMLTLFSEIGGLLGLLLGASVLTVFEFIDFFVVLFLGQIRCKGRRQY